jgi:myxalamid-type polyketide synthase MxaB
MAARGTLTDTWEKRGLRPLAPASGLAALDVLIAHGTEQACVMDVDWPRYLETCPQPLHRFLDDLGVRRSPAREPRDGAEKITDILSELRDASDKARQDLAERHVSGLVSKILGRTLELDLDGDRSLGEMGLDSLMAVELRNALQASFGRNISASVAFDYPTVKKLVSYVLSEILKLDDGAVSMPPATEPPGDEADDSADIGGELSDVEARHMLEDRLAIIEGEDGE